MKYVSVAKNRERITKKAKPAPQEVCIAVSFMVGYFTCTCVYHGAALAVLFLSLPNVL